MPCTLSPATHVPHAVTGESLVFGVLQAQDEVGGYGGILCKTTEWTPAHAHSLYVAGGAHQPASLSACMLSLGGLGVGGPTELSCGFLHVGRQRAVAHHVERQHAVVLHVEEQHDVVHHVERQHAVLLHVGRQRAVVLRVIMWHAGLHVSIRGAS